MKEVELESSMLPVESLHASSWAARIRALASNSVLHLILLGALMLALFFEALAMQRSMAGTIGFAMDDSWIHVAIARNFAQGQGWGIEPGRMLSVSTSPTWTLLLAAFFLFFENPLKIAFVSSLGSMLAAVVLCYLLAWKLTGSKLWASLAAFLLIANPISIWGLASGLELPLALAALMAVLYAFYAYEPDSAGRRILVPLACVFAGVTRPELFILLPLALLDTFRLFAFERKQFRMALQTGAIQSAVAIAAFVPYAAFNVASHGKIFPATYYAKTIIRGVGLSAAIKDGSAKALEQSLWSDPFRQVFQVVDMLQNQNIVLLLLVTPALLAFCRPFRNAATSRGWLLPLAIFLMPWVMGMGSPSRYMSNHADRYFVIYPPLAALMACVSLGLLLQWGRARALTFVCAALIVLAPLRTTPGVMRHIGIDAESTQRLYVEMPVWISENLDPKAKLAVNDIGGIAYYAPRPLIDVMGLATPEIWPVISRGYGKPYPIARLREHLREQGIEYIILSPKYYPELTKDRDTFEPIKEWRESHEHGRLISPQVLYRVHWR